MTDDEILARIGGIRQQTIRLYAEIAALTDAAAVGWKTREPGAPDITLELLRHALRTAPEKTRRALYQVAENDLRVVHLTRLLALGRP